MVLHRSGAAFTPIDKRVAKQTLRVFILQTPKPDPQRTADDVVVDAVFRDLTLKIVVVALWSRTEEKHRKKKVLNHNTFPRVRE